jgi:hypothetical protein
VFGEGSELWAGYRVAPAAKYYHQAYQHGLLEHCLGVAQAVSAISATFPGIDRDVAITGALLHDIGKLEKELAPGAVTSRHKRGLPWLSCNETRDEKGSPMTEDLLTSIEQQLEERIEQLRGAVDEHDRLQADLETLNASPVALNSDPEALDPEALDISPEALDPEPEEHALSFPARHEHAGVRIRAVSPKVARLFASRRPLLGGADISPASEPADLSAEVSVDEDEEQLVLYEHAI